MKKWILSVFILFISLSLFKASAQEVNDTTAREKGREKPVYPAPYHRNVIKFNPTPMLLWGETRNITFNYERVLGKCQSVSLQAGYLLFPRLFTDTIANIIAITSRQRYGVNLALDYRYYPLSRNRRPAPDGLYIGGYLSYYGFKFGNNFDIVHTTADQNGHMSGKMNFINLGMSLGYQFIFWKRFSVDLLLFGPSLSLYKVNLDITGTLDPDEIENLDQEMVQKLLERFPALKTIFSEEGLRFTGTRSTLSIGFRYSIQLGFHF